MSHNALEFVRFNAMDDNEEHVEDAILLQLESFQERNRDGSPPPRDAIRQQLVLMNQSPFFEPHFFLVYRSLDTLVGSLLIGFARHESPDYEQQKHMGVISPYVRPDYRRQGIGTDLLDYAVQYLQSHEKILIQGSTQQDAGRMFAQQFGAAIGLEKRENRLKVADIDWAMVELWNQAGSQANPQTEIMLFEGLVDDSILEVYSTLYTKVFNQQPLDNTEGLETTWTPERLRQVHDQQQQTGTTHYIMVSREPDGKLSGLTEMSYNSKRNHRISQGLTGVDAAYRGRGLGKWLKAHMLLYMRDHFPTVAVVATQNAMSNAAMNSINERLGFEEYERDTLYQMDVAQLAERLNLD